MEYVERYVHVDVNANQIPAPVFSGNAYEVTLSYDNDRVPYSLIELIAGTVHSATNTANTYVLKCEEIATNAINNLNKGSTFALMNYNTQVQAGHHDYDFICNSAKLLFSNAKKLHIYLTDEEGTIIDPAGGDIIGFNFIFKISYPTVGGIPPVYRSQIPL